MIDHIGLAVSDIAVSKAFYTAALAPLGYVVVQEATNEAGNNVVLMGAGGEIDFVIADGERVGEGNHFAFRTDSRAKVQAFHAAALEAGGKDNGAPGLRPQYGDGYYGAFVFDPDGMNVEAVFHEDAEGSQG